MGLSGCMPGCEVLGVVWGFGFWVWGVGFGVWGLGFWVSSFEFRVSSLVFGGVGTWFRV